MANIVTQNPDITASELREVFAGAGEFGQADAPLSRYLRPPGGTLVPDLPANKRVKNFPLDVKYSDYVGARFWYLAVGFTASTGETESRYHNKNDGSMVLVIRGSSTQYQVTTRTGSTEITQQIKSGESFLVSSIDGDAGTYIKITDTEAAANPPPGITLNPPEYLISVNCGYGANSGNRGLRYKNIQYNIVYSSFSTRSFLYLPWYEGLNTDINFINAMAANPGQLFWSKDDADRAFTIVDDRYTQNNVDEQKWLFRTKNIEFTPEAADEKSIIEFALNPQVTYSVTQFSNFSGKTPLLKDPSDGIKKYVMPTSNTTWIRVVTPGKTPPLALKAGLNLIFFKVRSADDKSGNFNIAPSTIYVIKVLRVLDKNINIFSILPLGPTDNSGDTFDR